MNELMVNGYIYYKTKKGNPEDAYNELQDKLESIGVDGCNLGDVVILRDENDNNIENIKLYTIKEN